MRYWYKIICSCALLLLVATTVFSQAGGGTSQNIAVAYTIAIGKTITLHAGAANAAAYQWYRNGVLIPGAIIKDYTAGLPGVYTVLAFNADGCHSGQSDGALVTFVAAPATADTMVDLAVSIHSSNKKAHLGEAFEYGITVTNNSIPTGHQVVVTCPLPGILKPNSSQRPIKFGNLSYDPATNMFTWNIPELQGHATMNLNAMVKITKAGAIVGRAHVSGLERDPIMANNDATDTQEIAGLKVPNVFTPNGDGVNDTFIIPGLEQYTENELVIINRWGNHVYEKKNYNNDWAGVGLLDGTYYYVLTAKNPTGETETYKGYVTLLRKRM